MKIKKGAVPFATTPYRLTQEQIDALERMLEEWEKIGWISKRNSPWGAPIMLLKKPDGTFRLVVDYRQLNKSTVSDNYPLPRIDVLLDRLKGCSVFSKFDLLKGYHQMRISPESRPYTAFITPNGQWHYNVLPMDIKQAPSVLVG